MTRHTIKPAVSEGRASADYGFTRLSQDEDHIWRGEGLKALGIAALCIGTLVVAVIAAVMLGAG